MVITIQFKSYDFIPHYIGNERKNQSLDLKTRKKKQLSNKLYTKSFVTHYSLILIITASVLNCTNKRHTEKRREVKQLKTAH